MSMKAFREYAMRHGEVGTVRWALVFGLLGLGSGLTGCGEDQLSAVGGSLRARVINASVAAHSVRVTMASEDEQRDEKTEVVTNPETIVSLAGLRPGLWDVIVTTVSEGGLPIRRLSVSEVAIMDGRVTEVVLDLAEVAPLDPVPCPEDVPAPICTECIDGIYVGIEDDPRCEPISCDGFGGWHLAGENHAAGLSSCFESVPENVSDGLCAGPGECISASPSVCPQTEYTRLEAGLCELIEGCLTGAPTRIIVTDGTSCGPEQICEDGACIDPPEIPDQPEVPVEPSVGCSDGSREGFLDVDAHPTIAGCAGAWTVAGITLAAPEPHCARTSGNDSSNPDGEGCGAEDLCSPGWHVCEGKSDVAAKSATGCDGAVPDGAPDKSLFFAVNQNSTLGSVCDESASGNDVFGCGNLGSTLSADKNCGPLTRVLASMHSDTCGYNEAEPPLGPWTCVGGTQGHLSEGEWVRKNGCPWGSCSYDGLPVGNKDKGGVLCCLD